MDLHDSFYTALSILRELDDLISFEEPVTAEKPFVFLDSTEINKAMSRAKEFLDSHQLSTPYRDD